MVGPHRSGQPPWRQLRRRWQAQAQGGPGGGWPCCPPPARAGGHQQRLAQAGCCQRICRQLRGVGSGGQRRRWRGALHQLPQRRHVQLAGRCAARLLLVVPQQRIQLWVLIHVRHGGAAAAQLPTFLRRARGSGGGGAAACPLPRAACCAPFGLLH